LATPKIQHPSISDLAVFLPNAGGDLKFDKEKLPSSNTALGQTL
jgi:hypothetical protein